MHLSFKKDVFRLLAFDGCQHWGLNPRCLNKNSEMYNCIYFTKQERVSDEEIVEHFSLGF